MINALGGELLKAQTDRQTVLNLSSAEYGDQWEFKYSNRINA